MKLEQYKPEIEFIEYCKQCNKIYKIEKGEISSIDNQPAGHCCDSGRQILLAYTNYKDTNNNKLYWGDVLTDDNNRYFIIIYDKKTQFIVIDLKIEYNAKNTNYQMWYAERYFKRLNNIYELPEIQKQFNIEC